MAINELLSQRLAVVGKVTPTSQSAGELLTEAIDVSKFRQVLFIVQTGVLGTSATVDFQVKASATSGGTYTAVSGTAITQLVKASNDNNQAVVCVRMDQLQAAVPTAKFIKGSVVVGTAASLTAVIALAGDAGYEPASGSNVASDVQTLVL